MTMRMTVGRFREALSKYHDDSPVSISIQSQYRDSYDLGSDDIKIVDYQGCIVIMDRNDEE